MSKHILIVGIAVLFVFVASQKTVIAQERRDAPNSLGLELLGRSLIYTISYQRMFSNSLGGEIGVSAWGAEDDDDNAIIVFIPAGAT